MKSIVLAVAIASSVSAQSPGCPAVPGQVKLGAAVAIKPENVPTGCSKFEILVARGTTEPDFAQGGKFGLVVGDPLISNITKVLPDVRGYPVQYPASAGNESVKIGYQDVVNRLKKQVAECPKQLFALVGYSQGAAVMRLAASKIPPETYKKIVGLVMAGDPGLRTKDGPGRTLPPFPPELKARTLQECAEGDLVCDPKGKCFFPHLAYIRKEYVDVRVMYLKDKFTEAEEMMGST